MNNNILDFEKCSNCGACYNACPKDAISVKSDVFYSLEVDETKCIGCGMCKKVCPVNNEESVQKLIKAYACANNDKEVVKNSSSGGVFAAIARYALDNDGVVYGATFSKDFLKVEMNSTKEVKLNDLMRSKYVESSVGDSFRRVKEDLISGKMVVYCGAPCQIAGLKRYLNKEYENLITCDFSCEGMPSHRSYSEYVQYIQEKLKSPIIGVNFRAKLYGWSRHSIKISAENGKTYENFGAADPYFYSFVGSRTNLREYCYECKFANNHYADIILADFWAYHKISKIENDETGLSLIITNSRKGEEVMNQISNQLAITILELDKAKYNMKERKPEPDMMKKRENFLITAKEKGFIKAFKEEKPMSKGKMKFRFAMSRIKAFLK